MASIFDSLTHAPPRNMDADGASALFRDRPHEGDATTRDARARRWASRHPSPAPWCCSRCEHRVLRVLDDPDAPDGFDWGCSRCLLRWSDRWVEPPPRPEPPKPAPPSEADLRIKLGDAVKELATAQRDLAGLRAATVNAGEAVTIARQKLVEAEAHEMAAREAAEQATATALRAARPVPPFNAKPAREAVEAANVALDRTTAAQKQIAVELAEARATEGSATAKVDRLSRQLLGIVCGQSIMGRAKAAKADCIDRLLQVAWLTGIEALPRSHETAGLIAALERLAPPHLPRSASPGVAALTVFLNRLKADPQAELLE